MKTPAFETLKGANRWLTSPSTLGGLGAAFLAVLYGAATIDFPPGTLLPFIVIATVVVGVMTFFGDSYEQAGLRTLRALAEGKKPLTEKNLHHAVRETFDLPARSFRAALVPWCAGVLLVALLFKLVPKTSAEASLRIAFLGLVLAPLSSFIAYFLVIERGRHLVIVLAGKGLSALEVIRARPEGNRRLGNRLVFFVATLTLTPIVLISDLVFARSEHLFEQISLAPVAERSALLAQAPVFGGVELFLAVAICTMAIAASLIFSSALRSPLRRIADEARRIAGGAISNVRVIPAEDEMWTAAAAFAQMHEQMGRALEQMGRATGQLGGATGNLVQAFSAQTEGAAEQSTALNETSATTEELARSASQISGNASEVEQLAARTLAAAQAGRRGADAFFQAMVRMREGNQRIADSVVKLNKRVQQIGRVVEFINGVGDKSDLLAVNAELEGTKAGDVGRGFSLVAAEMRRLAETVLRSTGEIETLISEIRDGTHAAVMATESGLKAMDAGSSRANEVLDHLRAIVEHAQETSEAVKTISLATQQQESSTDQLASAMASILRITLEGQQSTSQMAQANDNLASIASKLEDVVSSFRGTEAAGG